MHVLSIAVDVVNEDALSSGVLSNVVEDTRPYVISEQGLAMLCRPDEVDPDLYIGHGFIRLKPGKFLEHPVLPLKWEAIERRR